MKNCYLFHNAATLNIINFMKHCLVTAFKGYNKITKKAK